MLSNPSSPSESAARQASSVPPGPAAAAEAPSLPENADGLRIRPEEIRPALRLVLGPPGRAANEEVVVEFLQFARARRMDLGRIRVVRVGKRIGFAVVPLPSPCGMRLILTPPQLGTGVSEGAATEAMAATVEGERGGGATLAQGLVPPEGRPLVRCFETAGFGTLTTLIYLHRKTARRPGHGVRLPAGYFLERYTPAARPLLAGALERSYVGSFDCPELTRLRSVEQAIQGHEAAGEFRPEWWHLLMRRADPAPQAVGALLLSGIGVGASGGLELVYIGLDPEVRGRGLGDALVCFALDQASRTPGRQLVLAADARNAPALELYRRHGFRRAQRRIAMLRDLRTR